MYAFKPAEDTVVSVSLCGSSYDTALALYYRSNDWAELVEAACNDDYCSTQSYLQVKFTLLAELAIFTHSCMHDRQARA